MPVTLRRLLLLWLLMFWQGGFLFYAAVVVEVGTQLLGSTSQGEITQRVTNWLNLAGVAALGAWAWDIAVEPAQVSRRRRWLLWCFLAGSLAALAVLHLPMDDLLSESPAPRDSFRALHRWYLRISTAQWFASVVLSWETLCAWSPRDPLAEARS